MVEETSVKGVRKDRLKPTGTDLYEILRGEWEAGVERSILVAKYGVKWGTLRGWASDEGWHFGSKRDTSRPPVPPEIIPAPKIKLLQPNATRGKTKAQVQVLLLSDLHAGRVTADYNPEVFRQRVRELFGHLTRIQSLHAQQHPLEKLVIMSLGDQVQGENVGYQMELDEFVLPVFDQVYKLWVPAMTEFLVSLLQVYRTVEWYSVNGNHGKPGKRIASRSTNWDAVANHALMQTVVNYPQVTFKLEGTAFYQMVDVLGWRYMITHGDVIKMNYTLPWYGIDRKTGRWSLEFDKVDGFCLGHFHSPSWIRPYGKPIINNGTMVTGDEWAIGTIGMSGNPYQVTFGVHPERPVTWMYQLELQ